MKIAKISILLIAICAGIYFINIQAHSGKSKLTTRNDSLNNYYNNLPAPNTNSSINDFEHLLNRNEIASIDSLIKIVNARKDIVIVVLSLDNTMVNNRLFDDITLKVAREWGIGDKIKNNGMLIGFSKSLRAIRIQNAENITTRLSNEETSIIVDQTIITEFRKGNYFLGIMKAIQEIEMRIK